MMMTFFAMVASSALLAVQSNGPWAGGGRAPALRAPAPPRLPAKGTSLVVVGQGGSDSAATYSDGESDPPVISVLGSALSPSGVAIDARGTVYATSNGAVAEFAKGHTNPTKTLTNGLALAYAVAVNSKRTLFVLDLVYGIVEFPAGASKPSVTISAPELEVDAAETFDVNDNLYVATPDGHVYVIAAGTRKVKNLGLNDLFRPSGIAFDSTGLLYVSNAAGVYVYRLGKRDPIRIILTSTSSPGQLAFDANGLMYVVMPNQYYVAIYLPGADQPWGSITQGMNFPVSITIGGS
jgi:hypothetical protein